MKRLDRLPEPTYTRRAVAFVDVLGWKALVADGREIDPQLRQSLSYMKELYEVSLAELAVLGPDKVCKLTHFSDSIVVSSGTSPLEIVDLLETLSIIYQHFFTNGLLLRGGLTIGSIFHHETTVFGPALISAWKLESEHAIFPRIIVDPTFLKEFKETPELFIDPQNEDEVLILDGVYRDMVRQDSDGYYFVDFLRVREWAGPFSSEFISSELLAHETDSVRRKYSWMRNYWKTDESERLAAEEGWDGDFSSRPKRPPPGKLSNIE